ncbi:carbonic anhydrase [Anopheles darlingi]|uniref:Carbonic anhydrase n=1 Tax=Anopheles darlingi TaxID=43151 RepID=W5JJ58_ANODA|nr:carbonic anhydrase [Anopheles darlingi]ETN63333.1 carbonic anhydrase [Anopheles darlingi]
MIIRKMKCLVLVQLIACILFTGSTADDEWHYPSPDPTGVINEPEAWGGQCDSGRRQSPIALSRAAAVRGEFGPLIFNNYKLPIRQALLTNTGHSVQVNNNDTSVTIQGGGLPGRYVLDQLHFHWGSEHTIDGVRYALELHLVHHSTLYPTLNDAVAVKNGVAVIGVLFHVAAQPNMHIGTILETAIDIRSVPGQVAPLKAKLAPNSLLPVNRTAYFRYEGSLTTPACAESVIWTVFPESVALSLDQVDQFKVIHDQSGHELVNNYRSVQPLNARSLVYAREWERASDSASGSASTAFPVMGLLLVLLVISKV